MYPFLMTFSPTAQLTPLVKFTNRQFTAGPLYTFTLPTTSQFSSRETCRTQ